MKNNRLKGVTLIETMLYIGLFSVIIIIVLNFMLATQEASMRNNRRGNLNQSSEFITQHINYSFDKALSINEINSTFNNDLGVLEFQFSDGYKQYSILNNTLYFDSIPITPPSIIVSSFFLEPIYDNNGSLLAIRTSILLISQDDSTLTDTINILSTFR